MIDEVLELFAVPPATFVAERNRIAKELKAASRDEEAETVRALRRPRLAEYALNRLARNEAEMMKRLVAAAQAARDAQSRAIGGGVTQLREATATLRNALGAVVDGAVRELAREGGSGEGQRDEITQLVRDAIGAEAFDQLTAGVVGSELVDKQTDFFRGAPEPPARSKGDGAKLPARSAKATSGAGRTAPPNVVETHESPLPKVSAKELREHKAHRIRLERSRRDAERAVADFDLSISGLQAEIDARTRKLDGLRDRRDEASAAADTARQALADFDAPAR